MLSSFFRGGGERGKAKEKIPALLSKERITTLLACLLVALCSGTNYVYSAYAPQLGERLGISHTQLNIVAVAGNVGVYVTGPPLGRLVDKRGPRPLILSAFLFLLLGYGGIKTIYDTGLKAGDTELDISVFVVLVACSFLTGAGGDAGLLSAVNTTAKTFPERARASSTGLVISGFGLSAFLSSTIAHTFFPGNTTSFLLILTLGTSLPMIVGFFFVRAIPLPPSELTISVPANGERELEDGEEEEGGALLANDHLESNLHLAPRHPHVGGTPTFDKDMENEDRERDIELAPMSSGSSGAMKGRGGKGGEGQGKLRLNVTGKELWMKGDFWLLFGILSLVSGTGLMYINNIGSMSQSLLLHARPTSTTSELTSYQSTQVSLISITNFSGRIIIGLLSDYTHTHPSLLLPRSYIFILISLILFVSQIIAYHVDKVEDLWIVSVFLGFAYGSGFSLAPVVCMEWFGVEHLSENWGYLAISPMFSGNIFSLVFGRNLDAHSASGAIIHPSVPSSSSSTSLPVPSPTTILKLPRVLQRGLFHPLLFERAAQMQCLQGRECYRDAVRLTIGASVAAFGLSVWASLRDRRREGWGRR